MRARGFTLVELLVAIAILALVAVLGWRGLDNIVRSRQVLTEQMDATRGMQLAFAQLQSDGEHLADPQLVGKRPILAADSHQLTMVRMVYVENQPSQVQVVSYQVAGRVLVRRESPGTRDLAQLDAMWQAAVSGIDTTPVVALQPGVEAMAVRVFLNREWRVPATPAQARQASAGQSSQNMPNGMEVSLQVPGQEALMTKVFLLGGT